MWRVTSTQKLPENLHSINSSWRPSFTLWPWKPINHVNCPSFVFSFYLYLLFGRTNTLLAVTWPMARSPYQTISSMRVETMPTLFIITVARPNIWASSNDNLNHYVNESISSSIELWAPKMLTVVFIILSPQHLSRYLGYRAEKI